MPISISKQFKIDHNKALPSEYFLQKTEFIAKDLIGKYLVKIEDNISIAAKIVETEAYLNYGDFASHSAVGKTARNMPMFDQGGVLYVYKIYGVHHCSNIICEEKNIGCGVLLRAAEPELGIQKMIENRNADNIKNLCKGPGNLSKAYGFNLSDNYKSVCSKNLFIQSCESIPDMDVAITQRVGITKSAELPLRFCLKTSSSVSGKRNY